MMRAFHRHRVITAVSLALILGGTTLSLAGVASRARRGAARSEVAGVRRLRRNAPDDECPRRLHRLVQDALRAIREQGTKVVLATDNRRDRHADPGEATVPPCSQASMTSG
jgi:hypothetical protein